jgi:hypothetical protein
VIFKIIKPEILSRDKVAMDPLLRNLTCEAPKALEKALSIGT